MADSLREVTEKYQEVKRLMKEYKSSKDLNEIFEKKSKTMEILMEILDIIPEETTDDTVTALTHLNLGILHADMQETGSAKEYLTKCINLFETIKQTPRGILPAINAYNQIGVLYAQQGSYKEARDFLKQAESLYIDFTEKVGFSPIMANALIIEEIEDDLCPEIILEKLHTLTLYYLAQVSRELDDRCSFALYCHRTLGKQLSQYKTTQELDYVEWALNAATISQYFIEHDKFPQARHHLAAASCVLQKYSEILKEKGTKETSEIIAAEYEKYDHRSADIARCWAKYGIALLSASKEKLMKRTDEDDQSDDSKPTKVINEVDKCPKVHEAMEDPRFVDLEPELEIFTSEVTDKYLLDFDDARPVFLNIRKWLEKAMEYYTFENHASDYAAIAQDISQAYKYLAFYEMDEDRQAKMHKRRIDILEEVIQGLSPRFYRTVCREIWIELSEIYLEILDMKIDRLQASNEKPTAQTIAKIERLARNCINHYESYLNSLEMKKSSNGVESFSDDHLHQALYSYFHIGRLYNKIITSNMQLRIENMQKSIDAYGFVANYYHNHPEKQQELQKYEFIKLSKEFVTLLPHTIDRLKQKQTN